jgi:hypothetical protein
MRSLDALTPQRSTIWIVIVALVGLVLRVSAADGALWLDEAWSVTLAHDAATPLGVFVQINHDNNHHLNSLWLQTVGLGAPPIVARALSIAAGTLAIVMAGLIGLRRGPIAGLATAFLFALSPVLVTLGSEARGYAPMVLTVLVSAWYIDRYLAGEESADRPVTLAVCVFVGALFQLTMVFAACALIGWPFLTLWRRDGFKRAALETARLLGPALAALVFAAAIVFAPALLVGPAFRFGSYQDFTILLFLRGTIDLIGFMLGAPYVNFFLPAGAVILVILSRSWGSPRLPFYALAIIVFPLTVALLNMMNAGHGRYYLLTGIALLLLLGEALAAAVRAGGWKALAAAGGLVAFSTASMALNLDLIQNRRGDSGAAIRALAARAPQGTHVFIDRETAIALLRVASAQAGYKLDISMHCPAARFVFVDWFDGENASPAAVERCGGEFRQIATADGRGMSSQNWTLYERVD